MALGVMAGIGARKPKIVRRRFAKHPEPVWNCKNKKSRVMRHSEGDGVAVGRGGHISTREGASHGQPRHTWARKEKTKEKGRQAEGRASETSSCVQTSAAGRATATQSWLRGGFVAQYSQSCASLLADCGKKPECRHSEPAAAGEESLLIFCFEIAGNLRFEWPPRFFLQLVFSRK
jgi:hypothetical protein